MAQENNSNNHYEFLNEKQKEVAPKIEELLSGLTFMESKKLLYRVIRVLEEKCIVNPN